MVKGVPFLAVDEIVKLFCMELVNGSNIKYSMVVKKSINTLSVSFAIPFFMFFDIFLKEIFCYYYFLRTRK